MSKPIEMSRAQLYAAVWTKPIAIAAAELGMTSARLKRLCREREVPLPSLGHWRKSPERRERDLIPLPKVDPSKETFSITRSRWQPIRQVSALEPSPGGPTLRHECARRTAAELERSTPDKRGKLVSIGPGIASVAIRPHNVPRALSFLDALFEAVDDAGMSITRQSIPTALVVAGVQVPFSLTEDQRGLLLVLGDDVGDGQRHWRDGVGALLEDKVADIVGSTRLHAQAIEGRDQRIAIRNAERRSEEVDRAQFSKRLAFLTEHADRLVEADRMQRLAEHLRTTDDGSSARLPDILQWADEYVAQLRDRCSAASVDHEAGEWGIW